jgi:methanogenic corrinoid protein MtbC1
VTAVADLYPRYWAALETGDSAAAVGVAVGALEAGASLLDLLEGLVGAGQAEVGARWAANDWNVAQEHRATSVSEEVVAALAGRVTAPLTGRRALVTCADREWHSLPSRVLTAALRSAGWQVQFLGAAVPARHLAQVLHEFGPDVTAVSCALPTRLFEARQMIEVSRAAGIPVIVGGRGFGPQGRWAAVLGADAWAPDARGALARLDTLAAFTTPVPPLPRLDDAIDGLRTVARTVVDESVHRMTAALPDVARYDPGQLERTEEDVFHIVDFLCAALYVDDAALFTDFVGWLQDILVARGVPATTLSQGLRVISDVLVAQPGSYERPVRFLAAGIAQLDGGQRRGSLHSPDEQR